MDASVISAIAIWIIFVSGVCIISEWYSYNTLNRYSSPKISNVLDDQIDAFFENMKIEFKKRFQKESFENLKTYTSLGQTKHYNPISEPIFKDPKETELITMTDQILYNKVPYDTSKIVDMDTPVSKSNTYLSVAEQPQEQGFDPIYTDNMKTTTVPSNPGYSVKPMDNFSSNLFSL